VSKRALKEGGTLLWAGGLVLGIGKEGIEEILDEKGIVYAFDVE